MARIRTIKPEFWTSEQIAECQPISRLLFIGLLNFCDDNGIHPASIKRLKMQVFPADDFSGDDLSSMLSDLQLNGLLVEYVADSRNFWIIPTWKKHQTIDKPTFRHPPPDFDEKPDEYPTERMKRYLFNAKDIKKPDNSTSGRIALDQGMERNGKERNGVNQTPLSGKPDGEALQFPENPNQNGKKKIKAEAIEILQFLNTKTGKHYRPGAENIDLIMARLREGFRSDELRAVVAIKCREWLNDDRMHQFLRPKTLFGKTNFSNYVGDVPPEAMKQEIEAVNILPFPDHLLSSTKGE